MVICFYKNIYTKFHIVVFETAHEMNTKRKQSATSCGEVPRQSKEVEVSCAEHDRKSCE